ncbi:hypothetical protein [Actinoplanes sp. TFC3]|uniref:hypothetical protein n=1 Tax=Actinoplanes sp. TFC3 TaxID=1710355 RepID=UPI000829DD46|nr:hypothetical protein [Actinoplanes sp. TFC3]
MNARLPIDVDHRAMDVVRHLRGSPEEVFDRPYGGYLLLMATEFDAAAMHWLRHNAVRLDAMTGSDVAFAVFTSTFRVAVGVPGSPAAHPGRPELPLPEVQEHGTVRHLLTRGKLGTLAAGDELTLRTDGAGATARAFGVAADLPCLLVIDALPGEQVEIIPLTGVDLDGVVRLAGVALARLSRAPGLAGFRRVAARLVAIEQRIHADEALAERLSARLETMPAPELMAEPVRRAYERARAALAAGATRKFTTNLRHALPSDVVRAAGRRAFDQRPELLHTDRTMRTLAHYLRDYPWPLPEPQRSAYQRVVERYATGATDCDELIEQLKARNTEIVDRILGTLPPLASLVAGIEDRQRCAAATMAAQLRDTMARLDTLRAARRDLITELAAIQVPSLSAIVAECASTTTIPVHTRKIGNFASAYAGAALSPQTLQDLSRAAAQ